MLIKIFVNRNIRNTKNSLNDFFLPIRIGNSHPEIALLIIFFRIGTRIFPPRDRRIGGGAVVAHHGHDGHREIHPHAVNDRVSQKTEKGQSVLASPPF